MFPDPNCWFITSFRIDKHIQKYFSFFFFACLYLQSIYRSLWFVVHHCLCNLYDACVLVYTVFFVWTFFVVLFVSFHRAFYAHFGVVVVCWWQPNDKSIVLFHFLLSQRQHKNINFVNLSVRAHTSTSDVSYFWYIHQHCKVVISFSFGTQKISRKSEFEVVITSWCDWWGLFCIIYSVFWRAEEESLY